MYCRNPTASAVKDLFADKQNKSDDENLSTNIRQVLEEQTGVETQEHAEKSNELVASSNAVLAELNTNGELNNNQLASSEVNLKSNMLAKESNEVDVESNMLVKESNDVDMASNTMVKESNQVEMDVNRMIVMSNGTRKKEEAEEDAEGASEGSDEESKSSSSTNLEDGELREEDSEGEKSGNSGLITARELVQNKRCSERDGMVSRSGTMFVWDCQFSLMALFTNDTKIFD